MEQVPRPCRSANHLPNQPQSIDVFFAAARDHGDGFPFAPNVLAHAFFPHPSALGGDMHVNDFDFMWRVGADYDVFSVALHEAGHSLGLAHSSDPGAVMYPTYHGVLSGLAADDVAGILSLYADAGDPSEPPTLASMSPSRGDHGTRLHVALTGSNLAKDSTINAPGGIAVSGVTFNSTTLTATFDIPFGAPLGPVHVTVTTRRGTSNPIPFTITTPVPALAAITPTVGARGTSVGVTIAGAGFHPQMSIKAGQGVAINNATVVSATAMTATLAVAAEAAFGPRDVIVTTAGGSSNALRFTVASDSLFVGHWEAEGDACNRIDGTCGSLIGGATFATGRLGQGFKLDGINDYVDLGNSSNVQVSNSNTFTVAAWVFFEELGHPPGANRGAPQGDMSIVDKMAGDAVQGVNWEGWRLLKQNDNHYWFCFGGSANTPWIVQNGCAIGSPLLVRSSVVALQRAWTHVVGVMTPQWIRIYVAGELAGETRLPAGTNMARNSANLRIGSYVLEGSHLNGLVDDVRLYRRALTDLEIRQLASPIDGRSSNGRGRIPEHARWERGNLHDERQRLGPDKHHDGSSQ